MRIIVAHLVVRWQGTMGWWSKSCSLAFSGVFIATKNPSCLRHYPFKQVPCCQPLKAEYWRVALSVVQELLSITRWKTTLLSVFTVDIWFVWRPLKAASHPNFSQHPGPLSLTSAVCVETGWGGQRRAAERRTDDSCQCGQKHYQSLKRSRMALT